MLLSGCFSTAVLIWLPKPHLAGSQHCPARRRAFIQFESSECTHQDAAQVLKFWTTTLALLSSACFFFPYSFCMLKIFIFRDWKNMLHPLLSSRSAFLLLFIRFFQTADMKWWESLLPRPHLPIIVRFKHVVQCRLNYAEVSPELTEYDWRISPSSDPSVIYNNFLCAVGTGAEAGQFYRQSLETLAKRPNLKRQSTRFKAELSN